MADKKESEEPDVEETEETVETEETEDDEDGWARLSDIVDKAVEKRLNEWSAKQKTTSTPSRQRPGPKPRPVRKQGFLSGQFFSNLNPDNDR
jgi:hypothetical protein